MYFEYSSQASETVRVQNHSSKIGRDYAPLAQKRSKKGSLAFALKRQRHGVISFLRKKYGAVYLICVQFSIADNEAVWVCLSSLREAETSESVLAKFGSSNIGRTCTEDTRNADKWVVSIPRRTAVTHSILIPAIQQLPLERYVYINVRCVTSA
ncbi:hypothetical protein HW555_005693 [Spodoptera exigua]|uniref:Uncharacterized protein n=1 Tax=Spodoptera exigua TaxID=7107 RepID=A0A835GKQ8_SPOEX|nr:hypothetical protein HW555_005693 [Spodoptera exigua]